MALSLQNILQ